MSRFVRAASAALLLAAGMSGLAGPPASAAERSTYIVVLQPGADAAAEARRQARAHDGRVGHLYEHALTGFSIEVTTKAAAAIARSPRVAYVERDQVMSLAAQTEPTGVQRVYADENAAIDIDGTDDVRVDVDVAVIDTGIDLDHPDLHVVASVDCTNESGGPPFSRTAECLAGGDDDHYHGTHVAGSVAALDNSFGVVGVAPGARLHAVKVLESNGSGSNAMVIAGIDYVAANAGIIEVANMSLGGGFSQALNDATAGAVDAGVSMVVAAGNSDADANNSSPASEPKAITVSALADFNGEPGGGAAATCRSDVDDTFADFSNWGSAVDMIAPGVCILSTMPGGSYDTLSGTSMASPHVAGAAALLRSSGTSRSQTESTLKGSGTGDWNDSDDPDGVKEPLLDVSTFTPTLVSGGGGSEPANTSPTASFTHTCSSRTCSFDGSGSTDSDGTLASYAWDFGDGATSTGATASHTYAADGVYTVTLTVTDDDGATDAEAVAVSVSDGSAGLTFTPSSSSQGSTWTATVSVSGGGSDTLVTGTWDGGGTGECTTNTSGSCSFSLTGIRKKVGSVTWTHAASGTTVVVTKP